LCFGGSVDLLFRRDGFDATLGLELRRSRRRNQRGCRQRPGGSEWNHCRRLQGSAGDFNIARGRIRGLRVSSQQRPEHVVALRCTGLVRRHQRLDARRRQRSQRSEQWSGGAGDSRLYASPYAPGQPNLESTTSFHNAANYDAYGISRRHSASNRDVRRIPAPLFFLNGKQINLQVPYELAGKRQHRCGELPRSVSAR